MINTTVWPRSWNSRSFWRTTVKPRWMSGAVGSIPSFTRSGRPSPSSRSSSPSGRQSTAFRVSHAAASRAPAMAGAEPGRGAVRTSDSILGNARLSRPTGPLRRHVPPHAVAGVRLPRVGIGSLAIAMIDGVEIQPGPLDAPENGREGSRPRGPRVPWRWRRRLRRAGKPRIKKLRLLAIVIGLGILAVISTVFGMLMSVASDIPQIENVTQYSSGHNSYLYDDQGRPIGIFAAPDPEVIDSFDQISQPMRQAVVSVEDRRFWSDPGIDIHSLARALVADVTGGATQGASTITEQFVKGALSEEDNRTVLEKLREAALAFQLTHRWPAKRILTEYLNSTYFGNGAYGVESAARVYFGKQLGYDPEAPGDGNTKACGDSTAQVPLQSCASRLTYVQAALLAGLVASPSAFDPTVNQTAAKARRDVVLKDMLDQHDISRGAYEVARDDPLPSSTDVEQSVEPNAAPYFTSWLRPQILAAGGRGLPARDAEYRAHYGGLKNRTTLDLRMQQAADQAVSEGLPSGSGWPTASLVAIDNKTGQVRAMVGGPIVDGQEDYSQYPFNLATEAERQPGSAFKPFTLAVALEHGFGPDSVFTSAPLDIVVPI